MTLVNQTGGSQIISYSLEWDEGSSGNYFVAIVGQQDFNMNLTYVFTQLTKGNSYSFKYRVQNIYGWSAYSQVITQIAARIPDTPIAPQTMNTQTSVTIMWTAPYNGGSLITNFVVQIKTASGLWLEETTYCNARNDQTVIYNRLCSIPMQVLMSAPFSLTQGSNVIARVSAINVLGQSLFSQPSVISNSTAVIQTIPSKPVRGPQRGNNTSTIQIEAVVDALTGNLTGGSPIISYQIDYSKDTGSVEWFNIKGFNSNDLSLSAIQGNLLQSSQYMVRYRAKNVFGWGPYSDSQPIWTIMVPGVPTNVTT